MSTLFDGDLGEETFRFIEDKLGIGIWCCDRTTGQVEWSGGFYGLLGLAPNSVRPSFEAYQNRLHPEDRRQHGEVVEILLQGLPLVRDDRVILPDRTARWVRSRAEILYDAAGEPTRVLGVLLNITHHREMMLPLKSYRHRYDALVGAISRTIQTGGRITGTHIWRKTTESRPAVFGVDGLELVHDEDRPTLLAKWSNALEAGEARDIEYRIRRPDGELRWVRSLAFPVLNRGGQAHEWVGISVDVNEERTPSTPTPSKLTGAQMRAARGILSWSVKDLAERTGISPAVIRRLEEYNGPPAASDDSMKLIQRTLSGAGIEFLFSPDGKPGLRPR